MQNSIACPLCLARELDLITDTLRFGYKARVYKCKSCSLAFIDQSTLDFPESFYEKEYHQTYLTHVEPDALNPQVYYDKMKKTTKVWADKFVAMLKGNEAVLDLGCSTGHFIDMVKAKTSEIYGCDLNKKEVEFCQDVLGLDVSDKPLKERFAEKTFDYIAMIYVLEHIAQPKEFLLSVKKFLKPEGKLVILVPNMQDALVNLYDIPEFKSFYYCIEHLFYYNPHTIKLLFESVGLTSDIEVIQEYPITNHLNWAYRRAPSDTLASRSGLPDVALTQNAPVEEWEGLWREFNLLYKKFLLENEYADRLWCVVWVNKEKNHQ